MFFEKLNGHNQKDTKFYCSIIGKFERFCDKPPFEITQTDIEEFIKKYNKIKPKIIMGALSFYL